MAKAYTKSDIIEAALLRFKLAKLAGEQLVIESETNHRPSISINPATIDLAKLELMFSNFYDEKGKDTFRKYASVDADCMKQWKIYNDK